MGNFYSCSKYPKCDGALMLDGTELKGPKETGEMCPTCDEKKGKSGGGKLVIRTRRDGTGTFISCSRYPKCKFIKKDEKEEAKKEYQQNNSEITPVIQTEKTEDSTKKKDSLVDENDKLKIVD